MARQDVREQDISRSATLVEGMAICHAREREHPGGHVRSQTGVAHSFGDRGAALGERTYFVYIMASRRNGTLYIGVTNNLALRAHQHRTGVGSTFTTKYRVKMLVWYEQYGDVNKAIAREKQLKTWERKWKLALIEHFNRDWRDLYEQLNA